MKKILEHGDKHFKGRCPRCGCRFDYDLSDIYQDTEKYKQELLHNEWCLVCPECENIKKSPVIYNIIYAYEVDEK